MGTLLLLGGLSWFAWAHYQGQSPPRPSAAEFYFHHDHIIGTSLDLCVVAPNENAAFACEQAVLKEIERLRLVFSTYDPASEISRLNRSTSPVSVSPELLEVLHLYEAMHERSQGAFNGQLGELVSTWKAAEKAGTEPDPAVLEEIVLHINQPGWKIDELHHTVIRLTNQPLDLNSIAKGYIIQRAALAARNSVPSLQGLLLNLGGDLYVWGQDA
ncbi:MAG TPA: FAD:protein FMN transferase, partial [Gemmataceae bacterium]|nr:FAD:protein FMN transferase [Gemmataceae bacterium]